MPAARLETSLRAALLAWVADVLRDAAAREESDLAGAYHNPPGPRTARAFPPSKILAEASASAGQEVAS